MTREEMLTNVTRKWGFEHKFTIRFAKACESYYCDFTVGVLYRWLMSLDLEVWA